MQVELNRIDLFFLTSIPTFYWVMLMIMSISAYQNRWIVPRQAFLDTSYGHSLED